jgi:hypothetical protein
MANFNFEVGTKVQSRDKDGYFVMNGCGIIVTNFGDGHAIIKTFNGEFHSTVGLGNKVAEVEVLA